jgi:hypothetical protein
VQVDAPQMVAGAVREGPLSIVAFVDRYIPWANAGGEWALHHMLAPLARVGHQVDVVSLSWPAGTPEPLMIDEVRVWPAARSRTVLATADVLLSHLGGTKEALRAAAERALPVVYVLHNEEQIRHWRLRPSDLTGVVLNTRWLEAATLHRHPEWVAVPSVVVHPPVPVDEYQVDGPAFDRRHVTLVNPCPAKGGELFYRLAEDRPSWPFLAVEGAYGQQLRPRPPKHQNVTWQRQTPGMRAVYASTRVLLVPSIYESYGRVAAEAMAAGVPVIAHPTPGLCECLGDVGLFADRDRPADWLALLDRLTTDRGFYDDVAARGRAAAAAGEVRTQEELAELEQLLRRAAAADRSALPSRAMAKHDPFRGRRRAQSVDIAGGAAVAPLGAVEGPPALTGATEVERAVEAGLAGDPAVMAMAERMDASAEELPDVQITVIPADGGPPQIMGPPTVETFEVENGATPPEIAPASNLVQEADAWLPAAQRLADELGTSTPQQGAGADGEPAGGDAGSTGDGPQGHDLGQHSPEPAPATPEGEGSGADGSDPSPSTTDDTPPLLADGVPTKATGSDGVVAWIAEPVSETERYDRAEAAEWVENRRPGANRKSVDEAVNAVLYE